MKRKEPLFGYVSVSRDKLHLIGRIINIALIPITLTMIAGGLFSIAILAKNNVSPSGIMVYMLFPVFIFVFAIISLIISISIVRESHYNKNKRILIVIFGALSINIFYVLYGIYELIEKQGFSYSATKLDEEEIVEENTNDRVTQNDVYELNDDKLMNSQQEINKTPSRNHRLIKINNVFEEKNKSVDLEMSSPIIENIPTYKRVGNKIYFGSYYINNKETKEPIEWDILEEKDGKALIISHYILDSLIYGSGNYEKSFIRNWLNNDFYNNAFNVKEKEIINITLVDNSLPLANNKSNCDLCNDTNDYLFLLSRSEVLALFGTTIFECKKRETKGTNYAIKYGKERIQQFAKEKYDNAFNLFVDDLNVFPNENSYWWLRSSVDCNDYMVYCVDCFGRINGASKHDYGVGVRPACWIKL